MIMMVMVNGKYMVQVEAETLLQAEHKLLDLEPYRHGINAAQAFGKAEMKTGFFYDCLQTCEVISDAELARKCELVRAEIETELEKVEEERRALEQKIKALELEANRIKNRERNII